MSKRAVWVALSALVVAALVLASCTPATTTEPEDGQTITGEVVQPDQPAAEDEPEAEDEPTGEEGREMVLDPTTGEMILAPVYGGSLAEAWTSDPPHTDTWWGSIQTGIVSMFLEKLGIADWGLDRETWDFTSGLVPVEYLRGQLAESYEQPDPTTIIFHIRPGIRWHSKPPMNGREFVAEDVVFNFHRITGTGSGFTEKSPFATNVADLPIESIEATDKYTVVIKLTRVDFNALEMMYSESYEGAWMYPPEVIQEHGDMQDWKTAVGTGPYMLTDWVKGSSITYTKNPDYWAFDEKFPEYRLPYLDEIKALIIPDFSTRLAALRTGKIARLSGLTADQAESLQKTNPELIMSTYLRHSVGYAMDVRKPPFDDIRVRRAMQMALDLDAINEGLYSGLGDTTPYGIVGPAAVGYYIPYEEWPQDLKDNYAYNPESARELLAEAGYPNGFKTTLELSPTWTTWVDMDNAQLCKEMWAEIGVDVEIKSIEQAVFLARSFAHEYEGMTWGNRGTNYNPLFFIRIMAASDEEWNTAGSQDPTYDAMVEAAETAGSREEMMERVAEADFYYIQQQWQTWGPQRPGFSFYQPWLVGYNGESTLGGGRSILILSRTWIDSGLKYELTGTR